jgi:hypothetical protein
MAILMDTLSIFEQFRDALGEDKAKVFAHTLGTMIDEAKNAATKEDIRLLRESLDSNVARIDATLEKLAEAQLRTEERLGTLTARVDTLADNLATLTLRVDKLTEAVDKLVIRSDRHEGTLLELKFRDRLPSYLGRYLRKAKVLHLSDLLDELEPKLTSDEVDDFLRADVLASGTIDGELTYVIGEVSYTAEADDVERAGRRAALVRKGNLPAVGLVACEVTHPQTIAYAREQGVRMWVDGVLVDEKPPRHE